MTPAGSPLPPLAFEETGSGPSVLLVHGLMSHSGAWAQVGDLLSQHFRVIRCDLRGHGRTPRRPPGERTDHVDDLMALGEFLGLTSIHVVGHGSGCVHAAGLALRAPRCVRSLTVVDPIIPRVPSTPALQEGWHLEMLLQWLSVGHGSVVRRPEHVVALQQAISQQIFACEARAPEGQQPILGQTVPDLARLSEVTCPVLALIGSGCGAESKSLTATVFGQVRRFQMLLVPGAQRQSPREAPSTVARLLEDFIGPQSLARIASM